MQTVAAEGSVAYSIVRLAVSVTNKIRIVVQWLPISAIEIVSSLIDVSSNILFSVGRANLFAIGWFGISLLSGASGGWQVKICRQETASLVNSRQ